MQVTMNKFFIIVSLAVAMMSDQSKCESKCYQWYENVQVCGSILADLVSEICLGNYYIPPLSPTAGNRVKRSGIADECCLSQCTPFFLRSHYCADSNTFRVDPSIEPRPCVKIPDKNDDVNKNTPQVQHPKEERYDWGD